ncbi:phytol kinase, partial [Sarracenia purpurea var. burkii]
SLSRKLVHILSGLLFMACWPIFRMLYYFSALGYFRMDWVWTVKKVALVSLIATFVESLPITGVVDDNISVPLVSMVTAFMCFGY